MAEKRVLLITVRADVGGGPKHVYDLARSLSSEFIVDIACPKQEPYWDKYSSVINGDMLELPFRKFSFCKGQKLLSHVKAKNVHVIHSHGKGAGVYGRYLSSLSGVPLVHTPHGIHIGSYGPLLKRLYFMYEKIGSRIDDCTIYVSESERAEAKRLGLWSKTRNIVVKNGTESIPETVLAEGRHRQRNNLGFEAKDVVVVTLSRFDYQKNMMDMLRVADLLRDDKRVKFCLVGDGPDLVRMKEWCQTNNLNNVFFPGFSLVPQDYLLASDIYLSTARWEGLPLAVIEAMALGLPVIASDVVGNNEAVDHERTGYLFPLGKNEIAASLVRKLIANQDCRHELGLRGKLRQRSMFSIETMVAETKCVYALLCGE